MAAVKASASKTVVASEHATLPVMGQAMGQVMGGALFARWPLGRYDGDCLGMGRIMRAESEESDTAIIPCGVGKAKRRAGR